MKRNSTWMPARKKKRSSKRPSLRISYPDRSYEEKQPADTIPRKQKTVRDLETSVFFDIAYLVSSNIKRNFGDATLQILPCGRRRSLQWQRN
jgi:hypothetical protein